MHTLANRIWAELGPTQETRLLRLFTPLGVNALLAESVSGQELIGPDLKGLSGFKFEIVALSNNAHLKLKELIGQPARLDLLCSDGTLRPWHGHVSAFALVGSDGGLARYQLTIEPWLAFLRYRTDSWVFLSKSVPQIIDEVLADYQGQGAFDLCWRWELAEPTAYAQRSQDIQQNETDLDYVERLLREEGLFYWFEHEAHDGDGLGAHTLVIADHNGAFKPNDQAVVRFTQSGSTAFKEDTLTRIGLSYVATTSGVFGSSWDHRTVQQIGAHADTASNGSNEALGIWEQPGAYAYEDAAQAERIVQRHLESLQAQAHQLMASGVWRHASVATTFSVADHASVKRHTLYATRSVTHTARNNLSSGVKDLLEQALGVPLSAATQPVDPDANRPNRPIYEARLMAQRHDVPVRVAAKGNWLFAQKHIMGVRTAIVVGDGQPVHVDRDGRIKVQYHFQRGALSSHRLDHPAGSNAPADHRTGTWVRVSQALAGRNWGHVHTPRLGHTVLTATIAGDPNRSVVLGALSNGRGSVNAQGNRVGQGTATSTGNAPQWFPGGMPSAQARQAAGSFDGHAHNAVLSGFKSQSLETSRTGFGAYGQLVFDDRDDQARVELSTTQQNTRLSLGHVILQNDNQRLAHRGHGLDLSTDAQGALRAGAGLMISTHANPGGSTGNRPQMQARETLAGLQTALELKHTLLEAAQKHNAKLTGEPAPKDVPVSQAQAEFIQSWSTTRTLGGEQDTPQSPQSPPGGTEFVPVQGGHGTITAPADPHLLITAPKGLAVLTPAHLVMSAGRHTSLVAGQDLNMTSQRHTALISAHGLSLFSYGKAQNPDKPNQEVGIQFHAASGNVSVQAQANTLALTADKNIGVASTTGAIQMASPQQVQLAAGGSALVVKKGYIGKITNGKADFEAQMKELKGGKKSAAPTLALPIAQEIDRVVENAPHSLRFASMGVDELLGTYSTWAGQPYRVEDMDGQVLAQGLLGEDGRIPRVQTASATRLKLRLGDSGSTKLTPILRDASDDAPLNSDESVDTGVDEATVTSSRYYQEATVATSHHSSEFLTESAILDLLNQHAN